MKILYDHQTFSLQEYGGISRIYAELIKPSPDPEIETELSLLFSNNEYLKELKEIPHRSFLKNSNWKYKIQAIYNLNKIYSISKISTGKYDLFHPTYYDHYFLKYVKQKPFVVTVLDMIHEKFVDKYNDFALDKRVQGKKIILQEASRIIAISDSTKKDIVEVFDIDKEKIEVIYLGSSIERKDCEMYLRLVEEDYILFIGNRGDYKNFNFFLQSIAPLLNIHKHIKLLCGGGGKFTEQETLLIKNLGLQQKVKHIVIKNDTTLISLYSNAICFVFPSLYEGFGIPVLEAFSCGCACAVSNSSSLPEVGGDAALYFNPEDSNSILNVVSKLVNDDFVRQEKIAKGYERALMFSWKRTREETFRLYERLLRKTAVITGIISLTSVFGSCFQ